MMLDHQNSVSIDTRQLSWEFIFIYSNPGEKKENYTKDQYPRVNFFDDEQISEVHLHRKICVMQND